MTRIGTTMLALAALVLAGSPAATAGEVVLPYHSTAQVTEDCGSQCSGFSDWEADCKANGYDQAFQAVRVVNASYLGRATSFEQGCLAYSTTGAVRSNVQVTVTSRNGRDSLTFYANVVFDFAPWSAPLNPPPATGTFTITGGTGRFAQATGSGTVGNVFGQGNPGWIIYMDGTLRLSHGNR
jgi:hypothetical protein